jgi:hypothetical protein
VRYAALFWDAARLYTPYSILHKSPIQNLKSVLSCLQKKALAEYASAIQPGKIKTETEYCRIGAIAKSTYITLQATLTASMENIYLHSQH